MTIGKTIVVIDDDDSVRIAIEGLVRSLGYAACGFASAHQFLQSEVCSSTACLITDIQMAGLSGLDLQARLVAEERAPPVIFITAFPDARHQARARALGALGFLEKPFEAQTLVRCIRQALGEPTNGSD
ncbi:response regulator transcription factor [Rhodopseudomonas sp. B29]|uniref:response regulator transcription factor n=1 Tax=Rhodopseudomonas sp. B29 TaxID=95607 RepID=UPI00034AB8F8|nr:response regulator [Rhodopseudomonas sp. B29]